MKIDVNTKVSRIIKHDKRAIEAIASISSHFNKLKNPILRKVLAPRVTLADAARIGNCSVDDFFAVLVDLGFEVEKAEVESKERVAGGSTKIEDAIAKKKVKTLDVRPILEKGSDPFEHIQDAFQDLQEGFVLEILNSFEPTPMIKIMEGKGVEYQVVNEENLTKTYFYKEELVPLHEPGFLNKVSEEEMNVLMEKFEGKIKEIDVRQLEMPEPMINILKEVESLPSGELLYVHHKKVPQYLLPELEERNFKVHLLELGPNNVKLLIH